MHQLQVARIEPQRAVDPDFDNIEQIGELYAMPTMTCLRESGKPLFATLAAIYERRDTCFALTVFDHDVDHAFFKYLLRAVELSARNDLFGAALAYSSVQEGIPLGCARPVSADRVT